LLQDIAQATEKAASSVDLRPSRRNASNKT
jgi:hypothetical protein